MKRDGLCGNIGSFFFFYFQDAGDEMEVYIDI